MTENRQQATEHLAQQLGEGVTSEHLLQILYVLIGTINQICEDILARRQRYGISYLSIFEQSMEAFAPVVARLSGQ